MMSLCLDTVVVVTVGTECFGGMIPVGGEKFPERENAVSLRITVRVPPCSVCSRHRKAVQ